MARRKLAKRPRQASGTSVTSRVSRSHSPTQLLKQQTSKRRNTVNSAYDESLKEVLEATAAEAAGIDGPVSGGIDAMPAPEQETDNKKKRKRTEDDSSVLLSLTEFSSQPNISEQSLDEETHTISVNNVRSAERHRAVRRTSTTRKAVLTAGTFQIHPREHSRWR